MKTSPPTKQRASIVLSPSIGSITSGAALALVLCTAMVHPVLRADWHVDDSNQTGVEDGSVVRPYRSIQSAIEIATNGNTIKVALGTYGPINTLGKSLHLLGGYAGQSPAAYASRLGGDFSTQGPAPSATIIEGNGDQTLDGVTFTRFDDAPYQATFDNFTVRKNRRGIVCDTEISYPHPPI